MGRSPSYEKVGLKKGPWTPDEDQKLMGYIEEHGQGSWRALPAKAGLRRCEKSCRLRWTNYLRPDIKRGNFSLQEDQTIIQLHALLGNKWSAIAAHLPKRTDNEIKNHWNTQLKKRLTKMGIDPMTHKPKTDTPGSGTGSHSGEASNLSHTAQWECARLEAEARIVRESKLQLGSFSSKPVKLLLNKIPPQPSLPPCLDVLKAWQRSFFNSLSPYHTKMHNMYAMMLATDDLESPTSTLSFKERIVLPISTTAGNNFLPAATTAKSSASCEGANALNIVETSDYESWNLHEETKFSGKGMDHNIVSNLQDDDIMVAVEAFIPSSGYDESAPSLVLSNNIMEAVVNNNMLVYDTSESLPAEEENLRIINGDASNWNVNLLDLVNDLPPRSPVF